MAVADAEGLASSLRSGKAEDFLRGCFTLLVLL